MINNTVRSIPIASSLDLASLREFVHQKVIPAANQADRDEQFPIEILRSLHELGWLQAFIPTEYGGAGLNTSDLIHIARELGYGSTGIFTSTLIHALAITPIVLYASQPLRERLCRDFASNFQLWSFCVTEPDAGFDIAHLKTTATQTNGGYLLNGRKCFITNGSVSDHLTVLAGVPNAENPFTMFYVPGSSQNVSRGKPLKKLGQRCSDTSEVFFDNVFVPEEHVIGSVGQGMRIAMHILQRSKTVIAAAAVGISERAIDLVTAHLAHRLKRGTSLLAQPVVQSMLATLQTEIEASWLLTCKAAATWDAGQSAIKEASMAKLFAPHTAVKVVSEALELFGGYGYCREYEIERLHRDVRVLEIYEGSTFIQQALIARELFSDVLLQAKSPRAKAA